MVLPIYRGLTIAVFLAIASDSWSLAHAAYNFPQSDTFRVFSSLFLFASFRISESAFMRQNPVLIFSKLSGNSGFVSEKKNAKLHSHKTTKLLAKLYPEDTLTRTDEEHTTTMTGKVDLKDTLVPFGGSAPPLENPDKAILGGKGLGLQVMSRIGVDVPPGFTLTTPLCPEFDKSNDLPAEVWKMVREAVKTVEADTGKTFGSGDKPLLFSCRSGAAISMPGMMDTVLNIVSQTVQLFV